MYFKIWYFDIRNTSAKNQTIEILSLQNQKFNIKDNTIFDFGR